MKVGLIRGCHDDFMQPSQPLMSEERLSILSEDAKWYQLWGWYLRASPSYERARYFRTGVAIGGDDLPADFDDVLKVYDAFGDVRSMSLTRWWRSVAIPQFGVSADRPRVTRLGSIRHYDEDDRFARVRSSLRDYLNEEWLDQIQPTSIIASIPIGLPKAQIMKQVSAMIDDLAGREAEGGEDTMTGDAPYKLSRSTKLHYASVLRYLKCLHVKSANPGMTLWQVGATAGLSVQHRSLDPSAQPDADNAKQRNALKELTSRALSRGHMIAENAARGIFPSYANCEHAMPVDFSFIYRRRFGPIEKV